MATPPYVFTAWCLVKHRDNFTFIYVIRQRDCQTYVMNGPITCPDVNGSSTKYTCTF